MSKNVPSTSRRNSKYIYRFVCELILTLIATVIFYHYWFGFVKDNNVTGALTGKGNLGMAIGIYLILYTVIGRWLHAFTIGVERLANILSGQILAIATVHIIEIFISCAITGQFRLFFYFVKIYCITFLIVSFVSCILTYIMVYIYRRVFRPLNILEIYGNRHNDLHDKINSVYNKYKIVEQISVHEDEQILRERMNKYDAVLLNDLPARLENKFIKMCFEMGVRAYYVPKISDILIKNSQELNLIDSPLFLNKNNGITPWERYIKRFFDIFLSLMALIIFSPILIITALAIHLEDGGPVFYRQERVTIREKRFMILKFRSMIVDAEKDGRPHPAGEKDDRITKVGKIIRACRIDELPQLINILKGDMSIVGPRPERWEHVEKYSEEIPEFIYRTKMKGGLTGYAQVYGKYNTSALDKLKLDLLYITNYSLLLDVQIMFETVKILVQKESTEGFSEEASKDMHDTVYDDERDN